MKVKTPRPFPSVERQLQTFGQRLREARLRRAIASVLFCERVDVSRDTLNRMEKGDPSIAIGSYLRALRVLGLDKDFDAVAQNDELGRRLQDAKLPLRRPRGTRSKRSAKNASAGLKEGSADDKR